MNKIKIGIIGCGYWGPNFVRNFSRIKNVAVKYVCDLSPERLAHIKQLYPQIRTLHSYQSIIKDKDIDAVVVTTPAAKHYTIARDALLYNKHVLVEKPITTKAVDARGLIELAKKKEKILMVGHTFKFNPAVNTLRGLIKAHKLGKIFYIYSRRTNLGPLRKDVTAMWDLAPHDISIVNYLLDSVPVSVQAHGEKYLPHNLDDVSFLTLRFPNKMIAHIHVSWLDPKKTREIVVVGSKKMAIFDDLDAQAPVKVYDKSVMMKKFKQEYDTFKEFRMIIKSGDVAEPKIRMSEPLSIECRHFIDCIRKNQLPLTDGRDGLEVLKVLLALQKSLDKKGKTVKVN
jgi:predicted dehydrogenase